MLPFPCSVVHQSSLGYIVDHLWYASLITLTLELGSAKNAILTCNSFSLLLVGG